MDRIFEGIEKGKRVVILGIGNRLRGDDGAGSYIAERLKRKIKRENILIIDAENVPENYIGKIKKFSPDLIIIIDAVDFNSFPGDWKIFKVNSLKDTTISTHNFSIPLMRKMFKKIEIYLIGIQPYKIALGTKITSNVKKAIKSIYKILTLIY